MKKLLCLVLPGLLLLVATQSCAQDGHVYGARETYRYWAGSDPDKDTRVLNGEYWHSAHWTKEYTLYMEVIVTPYLAKSFITDNHLVQGGHEVFNGGPKWFKPPKNFEVWKGRQGSLYFINTKTGHMFFYEVQM